VVDPKKTPLDYLPSISLISFLKSTPPPAPLPLPLQVPSKTSKPIRRPIRPVEISERLSAQDVQETKQLFLNTLAKSPADSMDIRDNTLSFLIRNNNRIIAMCSLLVLDVHDLFNDFSTFSPDSLVLYNLCVSPEFRKQGLAQQIIDQIFQWARQNGKKRIYLKVEPMNIPAIRLYRKKGFQDWPDPQWNLVKVL
jgi:ribosomal protein S18 acetylase RimI-like enzyme